MIIELKKYIEVRELLMGKGTTGSQAVSYPDGDWGASLTRAAVCIEEKGMGM